MSRVDCVRTRQVVTDYFEGALPSLARASLITHLTRCSICRRYVEEMRLTVVTLQRMVVRSPRREAVAVEERLVRRFRRHLRETAS